MRVTAVDDNVALFKTAFGKESLNELIDSFSGLDEEHHAARGLQFGGELFDRVGAHDGFSYPSLLSIGPEVRCGVR